jgi:peptidyl-prolyl cis-trans isomerase C
MQFLDNECDGIARVFAKISSAGHNRPRFELIRVWKFDPLARENPCVKLLPPKMAQVATDTTPTPHPVRFPHFWQMCVEEKLMKRTILCTVLLAVAFALPLAAQVKPSAVIMTVNDQPIYSWEVGLLIPRVQQELAGQGAQLDRNDVINRAVQRLVGSRLLGQEARRRNLKSDDKRVEARMVEIEGQAGGRQGLDSALGGMGATYDQLRVSVSETDLIQTFVTTQIQPQVSVTDEEVVAFYNANPEMFARPDMVRARHILARLMPNITAEQKEAVRARAVAAHQRVVAGEDFALVASEVSDGPNAADGGDMGFFAQDSMVPALANAAFALQIGEISGVIETQFGFHILKMMEKRAASKMSLEEARVPVKQLLIENGSGQILSELLAKLNEAATIVQIEPPEGAPAS